MRAGPDCLSLRARSLSCFLVFIILPANQISEKIERGLSVATAVDPWRWPEGSRAALGSRLW